MSNLHLLGNTLVIAPIKAPTTVSGIVLPGRHYEHEPQQWRVLQVGAGRRTKKGNQVPIDDLVPGDVIITPTFFESHHEFTDGVRIVDASIALGRVSEEGTD